MLESLYQDLVCRTCGRCRPGVLPRYACLPQDTISDDDAERAHQLAHDILNEANKLFTPPVSLQFCEL